MPDEFAPAPPEIMAIVDRHIAAHFPQLRGAKLVVGIRQTAKPVDGGKATVAATGVSDTANGFDYMVWFAWDAWQMLDDHGREAIVFHELCHCDRDEQGRPTIKDHDAEVFNAEIELYGDWWKSAQAHFAARN